MGQDFELEIELKYFFVTNRNVSVAPTEYQTFVVLLTYPLIRYLLIQLIHFAIIPQVTMDKLDR